MGNRATTILLSLILAACGPAEDDGPDIIPGNNVDTRNNGTNTATNNASNGGTNNSTNNIDDLCVGVVCDEVDRKCVKGVCVMADLKVACDDVSDLGEVDVSMTLNGAGDTEDFADALDTTCADDDEFSGAENAVRFTVPSLVRVDFSLSSDAAVDWVVEVREGSCADANATLICSDAEDFSFVAEPGTEYFLVVEPRSGIDKGAFAYTMDFTELECIPASRRCDGDGVAVCQAGTDEVTYGCGTGCADSACLGDTCETAFEVTASASFSGDSQGFSDDLDFAAQPTCSESGDAGIATPGPEVILSLPGLTNGQTVTVDTSMNDDNDNAIFVLDQCSDTVGCVAAIDVSDVLTWSVEADGDYFVVIDKLTDSAKPFAYSVDIE